MKTTRRETIQFLAAGVPAGLAAWLAAPALAHAAARPGSRHADSGHLLEEPLAGPGNREVVMDVINFGPGEHGTPHRHPGPVFGYIIEGSFRMQFLPGRVREYSQGQAFYEPAMHVHAICQNLSATRPGKFLAVMIKPKDQPEVLPVK
ncbi:MAG: cupin domain-containing protein [Terriglobia bacterium]